MPLSPGASVSLGVSLFVVVASVVLVVLFELRVLQWPCPSGTMWDETAKLCRRPCPAAGEPRSATYNPVTQQCECNTTTYPLANAVTGKCERKCAPGVSYDPVTDTCVTPAMTTASACSPMPQVDAATGAIRNADHFLKPPDYMTCSTGTAAELSALCRASACSAPGVCIEGDRWDDYDAASGACKKDAPCDQRTCTAAYCTSSSIREAIGELVQVKLPDGTCADPTVFTVSEACNALPNRLWQSPSFCFDITPSPTLVFTAGSQLTTTVIKGTIALPALNNADDWPLTFYYTLTPATVAVTSSLTANPDVAWSSFGVGVYTGPLLGGERAPLAAAPAPVASGIVTYASATVFTSAPFEVTITLPPNVSSDAYLLSLTGRPQWDTTRTLYTGTNATVFLLPTASGPGVKTGMTPDVRVEDAVALAKNATWVSNVMTSLVSSKPDTFQLDATMTSLPVSDATLTTSKVLLAGCTPSYCKPSPTQVNQKLAILTWRKVTAAQLSASGCSSTATVSYMLQRVVTSSSGVTSRTVLIGPSSQPLQAVLAGVTTLSFVDVLPIRTTGQYILASYVGTNYDSSTCKSPLITLSVDTTDYSDAFCQTIDPLVTDPLPPWMWRDAATGMCTYTPNSIPARDFYCMFDYGKSVRGLDAANLSLGSNVRSTCGVVSKAFPSTGTSVFASAACNPSTYPAATCITGATENATVKCPVKVELKDAGTGSVEGAVSLADFSARVTAALNWGTLHASIPSTSKTAADTLLGAATQTALWKSTYNRCGPEVDASGWAVSSTTCAADDLTCKSLAAVSGCGRNVCKPWTCTAGCDDTSRALLGSTTYQRTRECYPGSTYDGANSACCSSKGTYSLNLDLSSARGSCANCATGYGGTQCQTQPCVGVTCNGHGTCKINEKNEAYCECDTANRWFNISATRPMDAKLDCVTVPAGCDPTKSSSCYVVPFSCRCPKLCSQVTAGDRSCVVDDPLTCNQTYNYSTNATGCTCPECEFTPEVKRTSFKYVDPQNNKFYDLYKQQPQCFAASTTSSTLAPSSPGAATYENLSGDADVGVNAQCCSGLSYKSSNTCVPVYGKDGGGLYCKYMAS